MKILVTGTRGVPNIMGGVETHCEELFPRLAGMGYDIVIARRNAYVKKDADIRAGVQSHVWRGVRLWDVKTPKKKSLENIIHTAISVIMARWISADAVHIHTVGSALCAPFARLLGLKVVFTHHGPDYDRDKWGWFAKGMLRLGEWCGCKFANHVIVISDVIADLIAKKHGRVKNVHLIYNGVPTPEFCHEPEYFEQLGIEEGKYILGMCRFVPEKRLHDLMEAYLMVKGEWLKVHGCECPVKLVLAGDVDFKSDYGRNLKQKAKECGVVLPGFVRGSKQHSLLTNAMCYSLPSSHEGLPIALLEAMSYGLPVAVSDIPANLEVGLDPECYHAVADVDALAKKLESMINASLECQASTGAPLRKKYDMGKYDWDRIAKEVSEVYEAVRG